MKPTEIKNALALVGGGANKRLGQHFLIDKEVLADIVATAGIKPGDLVLEVGPGLGVLTRALLDRGAEVVAIEQDRRFVEYLQTDLAERGMQNFRIVPGDAAIVHWHDIVGDRPWRFVSNLPYAITSLALRKALWAPRQPENIVVLVQREVGERATSVATETAGGRKKSKTSLLSLMVALSSSSSRIVRRVPAGCFFPAPKVESAVVQITPISWADREKKWGIHPDKVMEVAKTGFAHPRKLLKSNLGLSAQAVGLLSNSNARAEDLSPEDWVRLARALAEK